MKTAEEILYDKLNSVKIDLDKHSHGRIILAMKEYAKLKCKEQRELCSRESILCGLSQDKAKMLNTTPEPKFD